MRVQSLFFALIIMVFQSASASAQIVYLDTEQNVSRSGHCVNSGSQQCIPYKEKSGVMLVRDTQAATSGGGGGRSGSGCWSACFHDYNSCMDVGPKNVCVSRMKTCLAICDRLSNRPGM